jgi:hypothetical protein
MPNEIENAADAEGGSVSNQHSRQSQDALRHLGDAMHHKFHKDPQTTDLDEKSTEQAEIPKVGSRDAPGG